MPLFTYRAIDNNKQLKEATFHAANKQEVASELTKHGLTPVSIQQVQETKNKGTLPVIEKITFCRYFSTMLNSGLSITETITVLSEEATHPLTKKILNDLNYGIQKGDNLSTVFSAYPNSFDQFFVTLVRAGEVSGTLAATFAQIEEEIRAEHSLNQKIQGAMLYPSVVFMAMLAIGLLMFFFILPQIGKVFLNLNLPLAPPVKLLFTVTVGINDYKFVVMGLGLAVLVSIVVFVQTKFGKSFLSKLISPLPVINNLIRQIDVARFCRVFSTLLKSGVPITQALEIALDTMSFPKFKRHKSDISASIMKGQTLSVSFKQTKDFPPLLVQMIASGERSGTLDSSLKDLASFYEEEVGNAVSKLVQILEPILMLMVGIGVGVMVLAVVAPIYSVVSNLQA